MSRAGTYELKGQQMRQILYVTAIAFASMSVGVTLGTLLKSEVPSVCRDYENPVPAMCTQHGHTCKYEDGNTDGKECWWSNDGKVWYIDGSEYRNEN
jgi:hypothetical protein